MPKILALNWKENPATEKEAVKLFDATLKSARGAKTTTIIIPPAIYLEKLSARLKRLKLPRAMLGAQDVAYDESGAHTGEIGPKMLARLGVRTVIIGHSERRAHGETDAAINLKIKQSLGDGLRVILCVGESAAVHARGSATVKKFIKTQLKKDLAMTRAESREPRAERGKLIIAYEPIWAIGTGKNANSAYARDMAVFIKKMVSPRLSALGSRLLYLYGGSVHSKNIVDYVQYREIDGVLVGGASLKAGEVRGMAMALKNN